MSPQYKYCQECETLIDHNAPLCVHCGGELRLQHPLPPPPVRDDQRPQLPPPSPLDPQPQVVWNDLRPQTPVKKAKRWQQALFIIAAIIFTVLFVAFFMTTVGRNIIFMAALLLGGIFLLLTSINNIKIGIASRTWPAVKGTILSSYVASRSLGGEGGTSYAAIIQYMYEVNRKEYQSESIDTAPGWWAWGLHGAARKKVAQYPPDKTVDVYYNPQSPETAFLESGVHLSGPFLMVLGVILLIVFLVAFAVGGLFP